MKVRKYIPVIVPLFVLIFGISTNAMASSDVVVIDVPPSPVYVGNSTTTKPSPVGQPISDYKPRPTTLNTTPPPSPRPQNNYNPNNDPDVKRGYENHQKKYGR